MSQASPLLCREKQETKTPEALTCHQRMEAGREPWASRPTRPNRGVGSSGREPASMAAAHRPLSQSPRFSVLSHPLR